MANSRFRAILLQRCPVCLDGRVFRSLLGTHKSCPSCGIRFERETGYFLTAMFFAYAIGFVLIAPTALYLYLREVSVNWFLAIISGALILLWPFIFRYSRILWLHADQLMDPRSEPPFGLPLDQPPPDR
ncbi:MAG: DUF983 domain-containing protein [Caldilineaceae bacterium]|nr:DUF983 domain-containing protein [Caldilineaceae bacterium]